jgi:hypothetical protein
MTESSMQAIGDRAPTEMPPAVATIFAVSAASAVRGALGTVYFARTLDDNPAPLLVADWTLQPIESALPTYLQDVFSRLNSLRVECKIAYPDGITLWAESRGLGKAVLLEAAKVGWPVSEVPEPVAKLDLADRATTALTYVHTDMVKFARPGFEKTVNFRGTSANHLRRQIAEYTIDQRADSAELLNAWCLGIILALENPPRK